MSLKDSVLTILYHHGVQKIETLIDSTEAKKPYLLKTLRELHAKRVVEFDEKSGDVEISPKGTDLVSEKIRRKA